MPHINLYKTFIVARFRAWTNTVLYLPLSVRFSTSPHLFSSNIFSKSNMKYLFGSPSNTESGAIYFTCHLFTHAYINKTINKTLYTHYPRWAISFMTYINLLFCQVRIPDVLNNISSYSVYRGLVLLHSVSLSLSLVSFSWVGKANWTRRASAGSIISSFLKLPAPARLVFFPQSAKRNGRKLLLRIIQIPDPE